MKPKTAYMLAYMWQRANMRQRVTWDDYQAARVAFQNQGFGAVWTAADQTLRTKVRDSERTCQTSIDG